MIDKFFTLAFLFFIGCGVGWIIEVLYRRFSPANVSRRWINPGFLVGPYLPLYGFGLTALYLLAGLENTALIKEVTVGSKIILFIVMAIVMTLFEYIAGVIFIKGMNVKLWDYSKEKFNFQGIICLKFSIYWALLGAAYYFIVNPYMVSALEWLSHHLEFLFVLGIFYGVFVVDVVYSLEVVAKVRAFAREHQIQVRYEELRQQIRESAEENKEKLHWFLRFASSQKLGEHLQRYFELQAAFMPDSLEELKDMVKEQFEQYVEDEMDKHSKNLK